MKREQYITGTLKDWRPGRKGDKYELKFSNPEFSEGLKELFEEQKESHKQDSKMPHPSIPHFFRNTKIKILFEAV